MTKAGGFESETRELLQAPPRFSNIFLGCGENHALPLDAGVSDEQDASVVTPVEGDLAGAVSWNVDGYEVRIGRHGDAIL